MRGLLKAVMGVAALNAAVILSCVVVMTLAEGHSTLTVVNRGRLAVTDITLIAARLRRAYRAGSVDPGDSVRFEFKGLGEGYYSGVLRRSDGSEDTVVFQHEVSSGMGIDDTLLVSDSSIGLRSRRPPADSSASALKRAAYR